VKSLIKISRFGKGLAPLLLFLSCLPGGAYAQSWVPDENSVLKAATEIRAEIIKQLSSSGVDLETCHLNLAIGFCTSPFLKDPASAAFARAVASSLVEMTLVNGEEVGGYAWEFGVWDQKAGQPRTLLYDRSSRSIKKCTDLWPLTAQSGSTGGHDTERSIVEICGLVNQQRTVVVLLSNSAATVDGAISGIGENASAYLTTLRSWNRVGAKNKSGASMDVKFLARSDGYPTQERKLDVVLVIPKSWQSLPLEGGTRTEQLKAPLDNVVALPEKVVAEKPSAFPWIIVLIPAIVAGIFAASKLLGPRGSVFLRIEDRSFNLKDILPGDLVCRVVGKGFGVITSQDVMTPNAPPIVIAELFKRSDGSVEVEPSGRLNSVNGIEKNLERGRFPLPPKGEVLLVLDGSVSREGLPPTSYTTEVVITFYREGQQNG
jgi:hypothetical protein